MTWWKKVNPVWQAIIVIATALTAGIAVGGTASAVLGLPELVDGNKTLIKENTAEIGELHERLGIVEWKQGDILENQDTQLCLTVKQLKGEPWQECLIDKNK